MKRPTESLDAAYFERIYADSDDPWDFASSPYELDKYADTVASLPRQRYQRCFEIGCSVGVLSELLLERCEHLVGVDLNERALTAARTRNAGHVSTRRARFERMMFPREQPVGHFDLVVVSEVAYYWAGQEFEQAQDLICDLLQPRGHLVLVHYTPTETDYPMTGDEVHDRFATRFAERPKRPLQHLHGHRGSRYRLDVYERTSFSTGA